MTAKLLKTGKISVRYPRAAVRAVNRAAFCKAEFLSRYLHGDIVGVSVKADIAYMQHTEFNALFQYLSLSARGAETVDCAVGHVVEPTASLYDGIRRVIPNDKSESHDHLAIIVNADIADAFLNVFDHEFPRGIAACPLAVVARRSHIPPGDVVT